MSNQLKGVGDGEFGTIIRAESDKTKRKGGSWNISLDRNYVIQFRPSPYCVHILISLQLLYSFL